jgi:ketosteroid isomerase-like protein
VRGKAAFAAGQAALRQFRIEATGEIQELRVCGDWAYCWNHLTVVVTPRACGSPIKRAGDVLSIFQKQPGGSWVLLRDANLLAAVS